MLGELAARPDVLALSLHVDYWDYIGWKDPFAQRFFSERQRAYATALSLRYVYTPQMVIDGRLQAVGSERDAVERLIARARDEARTAPAIRLSADDSMVEVSAPSPDAVPARPASVWLASFDRVHTTAVLRGENSGRTMANYNVVRELRRLGMFAGEPVRLPLGARSGTRGETAAILIQAGETGPILAAHPIELKR